MTSQITKKCIERVDYRVRLNQLFNFLSQYICNLAIAPMRVCVFCMMPAKIHLLAGLATTQERKKGSFSCSRGFFFSLFNYVMLVPRRENPGNEDDLRLFLRSPLRILTAHNFSGTFVRGGAPWLRKFGFQCIQEIFVRIKSSVCTSLPSCKPE